MKSEGRIASIRTRLLNFARSRGESFDFVLARYGVERFLYRLSRSDQGDRFILKGAILVAFALIMLQGIADILKNLKIICNKESE